MLIQSIINPDLLSLISRVRHTNTVVIADAAFPYWPEIETVDLSLVRGIPTVIDVLEAVLPVWKCGPIWQASEFKTHNEAKVKAAFRRAFRRHKVAYEPHLEFKKRVPSAIGLIRTGDTTPYGNVILESI